MKLALILLNRRVALSLCTDTNCTTWRSGRSHTVVPFRISDIRKSTWLLLHADVDEVGLIVPQEIPGSYITPFYIYASEIRVVSPPVPKPSNNQWYRTPTSVKLSIFSKLVGSDAGSTRLVRCGWHGPYARNDQYVNRAHPHPHTELRPS